MECIFLSVIFLITATHLNRLSCETLYPNFTTFAFQLAHEYACSDGAKYTALSSNLCSLKICRFIYKFYEDLYAPYASSGSRKRCPVTQSRLCFLFLLAVLFWSDILDDCCLYCSQLYSIGTRMHTTFWFLDLKLKKNGWKNGNGGDSVYLPSAFCSLRSVSSQLLCHQVNVMVVYVRTYSMQKKLVRALWESNAVITVDG